MVPTLPVESESRPRPACLDDVAADVVIDIAVTEDVAPVAREHQSAMHIRKTASRTISARTSRMPVVAPGKSDPSTVTRLFRQMLT